MPVRIMAHIKFLFTNAEIRTNKGRQTLLVWWAIPYEATLMIANGRSGRSRTYVVSNVGVLRTLAIATMHTDRYNLLLDFSPIFTFVPHGTWLRTKRSWVNVSRSYIQRSCTTHNTRFCSRAVRYLLCKMTTTGYGRSRWAWKVWRLSRTMGGTGLNVQWHSLVGVWWIEHQRWGADPHALIELESTALPLGDTPLCMDSFTSCPGYFLRWENVGRG